MSLAKTIKNIKKREGLVITPRVENWLTFHGESLGLETEDDYKLLLRLAGASKTNAIRSNRFGASARGTCQRRQIFGFLGLPGSRLRDPILQNIFNDGTTRHWRWQLMLMAAGVVTDVEVFHSVPHYRLTISMDAVNDNDKWVLELKGMGSYTSTMTGISEAHMLQIHTYLFATGWDKCIYIAEDKRTQNWREIVVNRDEKYIRKVKRELNQLNEAIDDSQLPEVLPECWNKKGEYKQCPYAVNCLEQASKGDHWPESGEWESNIKIRKKS